MGFLGGKECASVLQWPLRFATTLNMWDYAIAYATAYAIRFGLSQPQPSIVKLIFYDHFLGFISCKLMVQSGHFLCNVLHVYLV